VLEENSIFNQVWKCTELYLYMYIYNKDRKLTYLVDVWLEGTQVLCVLQIRHKYLCTVFLQLAVS